SFFFNPTSPPPLYPLSLHDALPIFTPADLDRALQCWNERYGAGDESLAIDGKTMCNALDEQGQQTHVMSVVGHQTKTCYTKKKRSEEHTSELQSRFDLVCRLLLEKK